jgi:BASS family bile acid:Na+ symporter
MSNGVMIALKASLAFVVFSVGLGARLRDETHLLRHPALFARSVLSVNVIMPLLVVWVAIVFTLTPAVELALVALAMSPIPPFLPLAAKRAGGDASFTVALLTAESVLAMVFIPLTVWGLGALLDRPLHAPPGVIAPIVITSVLIPLVVGITVHEFLPGVDARIAKPVGVIALIALAAGIIPLMVVLWRPMLSLIGNGTLVAIAAIALVGLAIGHALGGPVAADRPVLALATASRHPAVALAILGATVPTEKLAPAAVVLALITASLATLPYSAWVKRKLEATKKHPPLLIAPVRRNPAPTRGSPPQHSAAAAPARRRGDRRP